MFPARRRGHRGAFSLWNGRFSVHKNGTAFERPCRFFVFSVYCPQNDRTSPARAFV